MMRRPARSTPLYSSAASDVYKRQLPESTTIENFEVDHEFHEIGQRTMVLNARRLNDSDKILLALEDITDRRRLEDKLRDASEYTQSIVSTVREPLVVLDDKLRVISANRSFYR